MIERAMWIASGSHSGLFLMMMERDAPYRLHCIINHAYSHQHRHIFPHFAVRLLAQNRSGIYADAFGPMQPQASA